MDADTSKNNAAPDKAAAASPTYTVTVYAAAPGTPLNIEGAQGQTSSAGHMYYSISNGQQVNGYGFSPIKHGSSSGPGQVLRDEQGTYESPYYQRTMQITSEQYAALKHFGEVGASGKLQKPDFDMEYRGASNSCIDFTWAALNKAGLHATYKLPVVGELERKSFEGQIKVIENIPSIKSIKAPVPDSPLNREEERPLPKERSLLQKLLTEESADLPQRTQYAKGFAQDARDPAHPDHALDQKVRSSIVAAERELGRSWDGSSERLAASLTLRATQAGFSATDDFQIAFSRETATTPAGEYAFLQRSGAGASVDPAANRVHVRTADAMASDVGETYRQMEQVRQEKQMQYGNQEQVARLEETHRAPRMHL